MKESKFCKFCKETKSINFFTKNKRNKDNLDIRCKSCLRIKYEKNRKNSLVAQKKWRDNNKDYQKKWRDNNEDYQKYIKSYYEQNKYKYKKRKQDWRKNNPHKAYLEGFNWRKNNKEKVNKYAREWKKNKRNECIEYKLKENLSRRLRNELKKNESTEFFLGNNISFIKRYLESKFEIGMNWDNYAISWEIDHWFPCKSWNLKNKLENIMCWNYTNLKPMWKLANRIKSGKFCDNKKSIYMFKFKAITFGL